MNLANRIAIVTGASAGIGAALARRFAAEGANVVLAARREEKLKALASQLGEKALVVPTDVADPAQVDRLIGRTLERFGGVDILVNNAGFGLYSLLEETQWDHFRRMWEVNFFGAVRCTLAALPHLKERRGIIINISSVAGKIPLPYMAGYCASKSALNVFSDGLRMELKRSGVQVITVCPGRVRTEFHLVAYRDGENLPGVFGRRERSGISAERVVGATLRAMRWGRREVVVPWPLRLATGFRKLLPGLMELGLTRIVRRGEG